MRALDSVETAVMRAVARREGTGGYAEVSVDGIGMRTVSGAVHHLYTDGLLEAALIPIAFGSTAGQWWHPSVLTAKGRAWIAEN